MGDMAREPSMEEILSSIRRVIARDEALRGDDGPARDADVAQVGWSATADDAAYDESAANDAATPGDAVVDDSGDNARDDADVLELTAASADPAPALSPATPAAKAPATAAAAQPAPVLASPATVAASTHAMATLSAAVAAQQAQSVQPGAAASAAGAITLDALVGQMLQPMLKDWLDDNLPPIVERLVAQEIARIGGAQR